MDGWVGLKIELSVSYCFFFLVLYDSFHFCVGIYVVILLVKSLRTQKSTQIIQISWSGRLEFTTFLQSFCLFWTLQCLYRNFNLLIIYLD